ncbi:sensor histidine kinase [Parabacteroides pacaensis]|uniref:sensor histidine kinase n=1 Tax=Parabacteroides pacaensis TaxID=2086575 RepID=UPI000D109A0E|nr:histidine kinase [Parabacteroides pacaensis]
MKWNKVIYTLLFSGLGAFSYSLLSNYTDVSSRVAEALYSRGALLFMIVAFNLLGYSTLRLSEWLNNQYQQNIYRKWKICSVYIAVSLLFLSLNYSLFIMARLLAGADHIFRLADSGRYLLIVVWLVELVVIGLLLANRTQQANQLLQQEAAKLQIENTQAKYTALQSQLNPHFLFNSLNTLIAEIKYNPDNAVCFTQHLSNVYRYVLQSQDKNLVPLGEEVEFMHSYLFLHKVRLGNCIHCDCRIPVEYMECQIPPLTLQLLVENVIKHNSISLGKPMTIRIETENGYLVVSNSISPKKNADLPSGIGLKNLSNRCRLISDRDIFVQKDATTFIVKIPFIV